MRYLKVNPSSGIWQFRFKLPRYARSFFGVTEVTKSLRTTFKKIATIQALQMEIGIKQKLMAIDQNRVEQIMQIQRMQLQRYVNQFLDVSSTQSKDYMGTIRDVVSKMAQDEGVDEDTVLFSVTGASDAFLEEIYPQGKTVQEATQNELKMFLEKGGLSSLFTTEQKLELQQSLRVFFMNRYKLREYLENNDLDSARNLWDKMNGSV